MIEAKKNKIQKAILNYKLKVYYKSSIDFQNTRIKLQNYEVHK